MTKTKVRMSSSLLGYRQEMAQLVNDLRDEKLRIVASVKQDLEPFEYQIDLPGSDKAGLLMPPRIEILLPEFYRMEDGIEGVIHINTSDYFGIASIDVTLRDEAGNLLEKDNAELDETCLWLWAYLPLVTPAVGTSVFVRAVATDALGGLSIAEERLTLSEAYLQRSSSLLESGN